MITNKPAPTQTDMDKMMVQSGIVREFGERYLLGRTAANFGLIGLGIITYGAKGALIAAGAELVNQAVRSTKRNGQDAEKARTDFIDRHWMKLSHSGFAQKVSVILERNEPRLPHFPITALPEPIRADFTKTAIELGVRHSSVGPVYTAGKKLLKKLQHRLG